jgi:thiamine pyrophosphate-dependent acetolactate synthase large subunit-like protein
VRLPGIRPRTAIVATGVLAALLILRVLLDIGSPGVGSHNTGWGAVKASTLRVFPNGEAVAADDFQSKLLPDVDFSKIGEAFSAYGEKISDPEEVPAALARCVKEVRGGRTAILHARVTKL